MPKKAAPMPMKKDMPKGMPPKGKGPEMMKKGEHMMGNMPMKDADMKKMMDKKKGK